MVVLVAKPRVLAVDQRNRRKCPGAVQVGLDVRDHPKKRGQIVEKPLALVGQGRAGIDRHVLIAAGAKGQDRPPDGTGQRLAHDDRVLVQNPFQSQQPQRIAELDVGDVVLPAQVDVGLRVRVDVVLPDLDGRFGRPGRPGQPVDRPIERGQIEIHHPPPTFSVPGHQLFAVQTLCSNVCSLRRRTAWARRACRSGGRRRDTS